MALRLPSELVLISRLSLHDCETEEGDLVSPSWKIGNGKMKIRVEMHLMFSFDYV